MAGMTEVNHPEQTHADHTDPAGHGHAGARRAAATT